MEQHYFQPEIECAGQEDMKKTQSERLRKMVRNCYDNVPFYRQKLDDMGVKPEEIQSIDDIVKLPFTYKTDLRDHYPYGLVAVPREKVARVHASSGTTGKQTVVAYTEGDVDVWATGAARALAAAGCTTRDYVHVSYGYGLFTGGLGLHYGAEKLGAAAIPVSSGNTKRQVQILQDFGSDFLCCTPSYAAFIGETCRDMGVDTSKLPLRAGIFGAEAWSEGMRENIERLLNIKAYDIYGLSEIAGPGVSFECSEQNGLHVNEDFFYPEIIDPDTGEQLPDGEYGELVFTCIGKEALPLIRYRTRDISALVHEKCACGRTLVRMLKPKGRTDDMLIIRGVNVFPSQIEYVLTQLGLEPNYLIEVDRVDNRDNMVVQVEMSSAMFSDKVRQIETYERQIAGALQSTLNISAEVKLVAPKSLSRSEGKAQRVIDRRKV
ncbi:phenylacetate--CoA ligase family protein [Cuneatibacter caecimuris]|uniref:Phenylacetate-coenzyme A ligase n=1 Tax=Cuneatibacter caecimuris TaxID=1796618 RepID=A0A4Q7PQ77_9FIRM|nr:phenylacetate--CoA ligase [Cuneatibacter caecimuris]RZT03104.1 phenylacetate-CoA ligase [Cuneatibacter caecimuris]